jgi:hypothetical protein
MNTIEATQGSSALSQLLAIKKVTQPAVALPSSGSSSQSASGDSLSISAAALQALQGLGQDYTQTQSDQTKAIYKPHGQHRRHHGSTQPQPGSTTQASAAGQTSQVPQVGQTGALQMQAKA